MLKSLLESINREVVTESDEDLISDNMDTSIRDAYLDEDGDLLPNDVTEAKIKDLIENLPETDTNGITKDEIRELSESYTDIFDEHDYVFEGAVEVPDKLTDLKKKVKALEKKEKLSIADKAKLAKYQAQIKVLSKVAKKKGIKEAASSLYADDEEIVDQYKGSAKNERTTPELYADKEEIIDQGTYEDTEIDLTEGSELYADDEEINDQYKSSFNNTRTTKDLYADDEEIKDVGIYEDDELDLTDLDDDSSSALEFKGEAERSYDYRREGRGNPNWGSHGMYRGVSGKGNEFEHDPYRRATYEPARTKDDAERRIFHADDTVYPHAEELKKKQDFKAVSKSIARHDSKAHEEVDLDLTESSDMYADNQEIIDQYKSTPNIQRTGNNNYADNQEIKDVGVYEDDDLDLTDLGDDIESGCGSAMEVKGEAELSYGARLSGDSFSNDHTLTNGKQNTPEYRRESREFNRNHKGLPYGKEMHNASDYHERTERVNRHKKYFDEEFEERQKQREKAHEEVDLDLTAEEAFELELLEANLYADDEPVEDKYKTSPSGKIEHEDYYADNQEIKDVGVYESDDNDETPEVDEGDPGELAAESFIDLTDI